MGTSGAGQRPSRPAERAGTVAAPQGRATDVLLRANKLTRRFGGVIAVNEVSLELRRGSVHAVIGTNGAGKSTLINILSGELDASSGSVELRGTDITRWSQPRRARAGIGRSYQRTTIYPIFTVLENCRLAAQAGYQRPWAWWADAAACRVCVPAARDALARVGLADLQDRPAGTLSHGQRRQLEIAMCLATGPEVLLLDEPLAGMGAEETERMLALLAELKAGHAIALVEHDMDAVFRIADRITVMVNGTVLASDAPQAVQANAEVQAAYLGGTE
jgi:branched-chain amino acid transport system ATP-binding protein